VSKWILRIQRMLHDRTESTFNRKRKIRLEIRHNREWSHMRSDTTLRNQESNASSDHELCHHRWRHTTLRTSNLETTCTVRQLVVADPKPAQMTEMMDVPFVFGRNLQCELVRGVNTREECHWSHAWQRFKRSNGVKLNGTPRVQISVGKRAPCLPQPNDANSDAAESMVKTRTVPRQHLNLIVAQRQCFQPLHRKQLRRHSGQTVVR
jgi:hypothetical protein